MKILVPGKHAGKKYPALWQLDLVKVFNFPDKIPSFLKTMELRLNFLQDIELPIIKLQEKSVLKTQFYINHASDLKYFSTCFVVFLTSCFQFLFSIFKEHFTILLLKYFPQNRSSGLHVFCKKGVLTPELELFL